MAPRPNTWTNHGQGYSYNQHNYNSKRRFDSIEETIQLLINELMQNDYVIKCEMEARINSVEDRMLMAAEFYKERLELLVKSSRSQIWRVLPGNTPSANYDFSSDNPWNPNRMEFSNGYPQNCNTNYQGWAPNTIQNRNNIKSARLAGNGNPKPKSKLARNMKSKKTKPTVNLASKAKITVKNNLVPLPFKSTDAKSAKVPVINTITGNTTSKVSVASVATAEANIPKSMASVATTSKTTATSVATDRLTSTPVNITAPVPNFDTTTSVKPQLMHLIKTEPQNNETDTCGNISSLSTCDLSRIKTEVKCENDLTIPVQTLDLPVNIKTEPISHDDVMVDDLADHL